MPGGGEEQLRSAISARPAQEVERLVYAAGGLAVAASRPGWSAMAPPGRLDGRDLTWPHLPPGYTQAPPAWR